MASRIGRRTRVDVTAGKTINLLPDGYENFSNYWTDESQQNQTIESSREEVVPKTNGRNIANQNGVTATKKIINTDKLLLKSKTTVIGNPNIGRRTRVDVRAGKNIRRDSKGFENYDDFFTDIDDTQQSISINASVSHRNIQTQVESESSASFIPNNRRSTELTAENQRVTRSATKKLDIVNNLQKSNSTHSENLSDSAISRPNGKKRKLDSSSNASLQNGSTSPIVPTNFYKKPRTLKESLLQQLDFVCGRNDEVLLIQPDNPFPADKGLSNPFRPDKRLSNASFTVSSNRSRNSSSAVSVNEFVDESNDDSVSTRSSTRRGKTNWKKALPKITKDRQLQYVFNQQVHTPKLIGPKENPTPGLKRSKRTRMPPLEFWRNQRPDYKLSDDGSGLEVVGILQGSKVKKTLVSTAVTKPKRSAAAAKKGKAPKKPSRISVGSENNNNESFFPSIPVSHDATLPSDGMGEFINPATGAVGMTDLMKHISQVPWETCGNGNGTQLQLSEVFTLGKGGFSTGLMKVPPGVTKPLMYNVQDCVTFFVISGTAELQLYTNSWGVKQGSMFLVIQGNPYKITNTSDEDCLLFMSMCCGIPVNAMAI